MRRYCCIIGVWGLGSADAVIGPQPGKLSVDEIKCLSLDQTDGYSLLNRQYWPVNLAIIFNLRHKFCRLLKLGSNAKLLPCDAGTGNAMGAKYEYIHRYLGEDR